MKGALRLGMIKDFLDSKGLEQRLDREQGIMYLSFDDPGKWSTFGELVEGRMEEAFRQELESLLLRDESGFECWWTIRERILSVHEKKGD